MSGNEQVRVEIRSFLLALASYPDRFAVNPRITFEEHRSSIATLPGEVTADSHNRLREN